MFDVDDYNLRINWAATAQIVQRWVMGWTSRIRFPARARNYSPLHSVKMSSGAHLFSCPMGTKAPLRLHSDGLRAGRPGFDFQQEQEILLLSTASSWALEPTYSPVQWVPRPHSVCIAMGYGLDVQDSISSKNKKFFSSPQRQVELWSPAILLSNGYQGPIPSVKPAGEQSWPLLLVPRSGVVELYLHSTICLHGVVHWLSIGIAVLLLLIKEGNRHFETKGTSEDFALSLLNMPTVERYLLSLATSTDLMHSNSAVSFRRPHELYTNVTLN
jgi:hypothetical protein